MAGEKDRNLVVTSNFCGDHAGQYIAAALKEAKSMEYLTLLENIKYTRSISELTGGNTAQTTLVGARTCDFTSKGTLGLEDKNLTPVPLQVNYEICKEDLISDWQALNMKAGQWNTNLGPDFATFLLSRIAGFIAQHAENNIWGGAVATPGEFEGFTTTGTGLLNTGGTVIATATAPFTVANVIANLNTLLTAVPDAVYSKISEDLYIYMNPKTYRMYISAVSELGYVNAFNMNDTYQPYFEGCKIAVCPGVKDDEAICAQTSNLFAGADLFSDQTEIRVLDMAPVTGSDNIRIVAKYSLAVQSGVNSDITWLK
tara:strand:- start:28390 stop:29331 length:942 start_codon:yes stop_codon:yes gene_type:complete